MCVGIGIGKGFDFGKLFSGPTVSRHNGDVQYDHNTLELHMIMSIGTAMI